MAAVAKEIQIEPYDLRQLQRWVEAGRFVDLADAIQGVIHAGVNWWLFEEFARWERETYGGMTEEEFHKAIAEEGMVPFVKPDPPAPPHPTRMVVVIPDDGDERVAEALGNAEWERGRQRHIVIGKEAEHDPHLEGLSPEDFVAPADEWLDVYPQPAAGNP